jgi:hypothetical protein
MHLHVPRPIHGWKQFFNEIIVIAIGILIAFGVDKWRDSMTENRLAEETRGSLQDEIRSNRDVVIERIRRISAVYRLTLEHPEEVGDYVFQRRNRPLLVSDAAWTMAVQTQALRQLAPAERDRMGRYFISQQHTRELADEEMAKWTELAAYRPQGGNTVNAVDRSRAILRWQAYAVRVQLAQCAALGGIERALGSNVPVARYEESCAEFSPDVDPAYIYKEWSRRGWTRTVLRP